jgi:3',5'-cyclic AMP phosphodiesterase CpdA
MRIIKSKLAILAIVFGVGFFTMAGYEAGDYYARYMEDYNTETLIQGAPKNLNSNAIHKILARIEGKDTFRFYVIGDTQGSFNRFRKILGRAQEERPDFIIHVADITTGGRYRQYLEMVKFIEHIDTPIIFAIGNHDINHRGIEVFAYLFGPLNFYFDAGTYRFIFLDSNEQRIKPDFIELPQETTQYDYQHGLDRDQINILESLINKAGYNFVILHMPPALDTFKHHSLVRNSQLFTDLMKKYSNHIAGVFSGHIHGYGEAVTDGVRYIVSGGAGNRLHDAQNGMTSRFNYILVTVKGKNVTHRVEFID